MLAKDRLHGFGRFGIVLVGSFHGSKDRSKAYASQPGGGHSLHIGQRVPYPSARSPSQRGALLRRLLGRGVLWPGAGDEMGARRVLRCRRG